MVATVNITPTNDLYPHVDGAACPCSPELLGADFRSWKVIAHRSWDRREECEDWPPLSLVPFGEPVN